MPLTGNVMKAPSISIPTPAKETAGISQTLILFFAFCCGAIVANIYYAQPLTELIAADTGMSPSIASLIVSLTQIGYALGLFFLVPLADLVENRRLMIATCVVSILSLAAAAMTQHSTLFLALSLLIGFSSVSVQILIPLAAHLTPEARRGRVVGNIMGGLLLGILLARPVSSLVADHFGWRAVFIMASILMVGISLLFLITMPQRQPQNRESYPSLLRSLGHLIKTLPVLRQRAFYQACMFASFSLFWTAVPVELMHQYGFSQSRIALFALVGAIGAIAAPITGRLADAGHTKIATLTALAVAVVSFLPGLIHPSLGVIGLVVTGIVLDFVVQMNMVLGQREIYGLNAAVRGRLNALYMTSIFIGGAIGSSIAGTLYAHGGWTWIVFAGSAFPLIALAGFLKNRNA
jgi:predicted MFS family arabinose efflux permease